MELIHAIRADNEEEVERLLQDETLDVNAHAVVEGTKVTLYTTHALFEAARRGNENIVRMILERQDLDVNLPATAINITTLADACNRQDLAMVEVLLDDPRVNPLAGSDEVPLALQYAVRNGSLPVLHAFERRGYITTEQEDVLMATAQKYEQSAIIDWVEGYYLSHRQLPDLAPKEQVYKLWQEFQKQDLDGSHSIDKSELRVLAAALGSALTEPELAEAQLALDTNGDGTVDFEELVAFWLADEGVDGGVSQEVQEAVEAIMASAAQDKRAKLQAEQEHALQGAAASVDTLTAVEL